MVEADPALAQQITALSDRMFATRALLYKSVSEQDAGREPGPASSALKLLGSELNRDIRRFAALIDAGDAEDYLGSLGLCIGGGTSEVQRNILAERVSACRANHAGEWVPRLTPLWHTAN